MNIFFTWNFHLSSSICLLSEHFIATADNKSKISDELKNFKAGIANGDEKLLQSFRKKIIDELKEKDDTKKSSKYPNEHHRSSNYHQNRNEHHSRFNNFDAHRRDRFAIRGSSRRNNNFNRMTFSDKFDQKREK